MGLCVRRPQILRHRRRSAVGRKRAEAGNPCNVRRGARLDGDRSGIVFRQRCGNGLRGGTDKPRRGCCRRLDRFAQGRQSRFALPPATRSKDLKIDMIMPRIDGGNDGKTPLGLMRSRVR